MALLGSFARFRVVVQPDRTSPVLRHHHALGAGRRSAFTLQCLNTQISSRCIFEMLPNQRVDLSYNGGRRIVYRPGNERRSVSKKRSGMCSCWMEGSQLASSAFTLGTAAVLPFYSLMVFAPKSQITKKAMDSNVPYVSLGILYTYLLYLSWTPDTIRLMFASEYWLPELPGIARLFSSETTLASAWIHLLVIDLFAARHIYRDGLDNGVETRHSVSLCLLVCPIGILAHTITKALTTTEAKSSEHNL